MPTAPKQHSATGKTARQEYNLRRGTAHSRGYGRDWVKRRKRLIAEAVLENWRCRYCLQEVETLDHGIPPSRFGGPGSAAYQRWFDDDANLIGACLACNTLKSNKLPNELPEPMKSRLLAILRDRGVNWSGAR